MQGPEGGEQLKEAYKGTLPLFFVVVGAVVVVVVVVVVVIIEPAK